MKSLSTGALLGLLSVLLSQGPGPVGGIRDRYNSNAMIYSPASEREAEDTVILHRPKDWTLTIVVPIALGIFFLVLLFFCWVASDKHDAAENFDYQRMDDPDSEESQVPGSSVPHPAVDQILDLPYTPNLPRGNENV